MGIIYKTSRFFIHAFARLYFRLEYEGIDNLPREGPVLLAANHASNVDPTTIACGLPRECHFLAKEELFRVPVLGPFLRIVHTHPVNRSGVDRTALRTCAEILTAGNVLLMFPEGTRTRDGNLQEGKSGAAMIALQSQAVVVPVYIHGTFEVMGRGKQFPRPHKVRVFVGEKILPAEFEHIESKRERYDAMTAKIMSALEQLRARALEKAAR